MTNRIKLFTESVAQIGVPEPELEALTKLFKVCLESALEDEQNPDYYDGDTLDLDISAYGVNSSDEASDDVDVNERFALYSRPEIYDEEDENNENNSHEERITESTAGTTIADAYIKVAPKLLDSNQCTPKDIDNLGKFIDWLIGKFKAFDSEQYMRQAEAVAKAGKSYDADRMDKCLNVVGVGTSVVQLLNDIKTEFSDELGKATLTNEASIFSAAKDINNFVAKRFAGVVDNADIYATRDDNVVTYDKGFYDIDDDSHEATQEERMAAEKASKNNSVKGAKAETPTDQFPTDTEVETVDKALADFVSFIPSSNMSDTNAAEFDKPIDHAKKSRAKQIADQRAAYTKAHKGDVIETSSLETDDDPWADL